MTFELKEINDWVHNTLLPEKLCDANYLHEQYANWMAGAKEQREKICEKFLAEAVAGADPQALQLYIQNHQKGAIILTELLYEYGTTPMPIPEEAKKLYQEVSAQLEIILVALQRFFPCYFDEHVPVTRAYGEQKMRLLMEKYKRISRILKNKQTDKQLLNIILDGLRDFIYGRERMVTYYRVAYYEQLLDMLLELSPDDVIADADCRVHEVLHSINFNDPAYVRYYGQLITGIVNIFERLPDKLEKLHWYRKCIRQQSCRPGAAFLINHRSLTEQMTSWLDEEITYLQAIHQLSQSPARNGSQPKWRQKIRLQLSVSELGILMQVLYRLPVTKRIQLTDLLRMVAETCSTIGTEEISVKSLRNKSYSIKDFPVASENVRRLLQRGADLITAELSR
ncbi:hypothetical protein [Chitinophaga tropicalis]|uniref:Uncharacterized protein n=1 Tax=Chitinophaga tropicalis TaxID=2683588 RepID=A0A7K1U034_9BACT|nr:hypothetical protein [Chitinophaga tropicalis]MVT07729.1 hypothetical protein [Chitinophaga tropicalis]